MDAVRDLISHQLTKGIEAELAVADLLRSVLPSRFSAGKGYIIDSRGQQSNEVDLIVLDAANTARIFDFRAFELIPVEAALACIEVKTMLTKKELDDTFDRFHRIQEMEFHQERMMRNWSDPTEGVGIDVVSTSRPYSHMILTFPMKLSQPLTNDTSDSNTLSRACFSGESLVS